MMKGSQKASSKSQKRTSGKPRPANSDTTMIATATTNSTPIHWIEGRGLDDAGTVISEMTNDQTAFLGQEDSLSHILGSWPVKKPGSPKKGDDGSHTDKPSSIKTPSSGSVTTKAGPAKAAAKAVAKAAAAKAAAKSSSSGKAKAPASVKTPPEPVPKQPTATPSVKPRSRSNTPPKSDNEVAVTVAKKKAPYPAMDVSPNPQVRKPKVSSGRTSPKLVASPVTPTSQLKTPPKAASGQRKPAPAVTPPPNKTSPNNNSNNNNNNNHVGLSELSKQLRVQRAKNEWQHNEIARLERQLRILSDLKGVSVADLRFSLESACQQEAHGELRNQVQSLQAQLEALQMQRSNNRRASTANTEATASKIATLQLRIGELEEVDHAKQAEVQALYQQLQEQTAKATTLEATNAQQQAQLDKFEEVAQMYIKDVEQIQAERDALKQQVAELTQQLANQDNQRKLDQAMREIEAQIELEQQRKQEYVNQARQQAAASRSLAPPVNGRLSGNQLAAIQGVVGRQAGVPMDASTIATSVRQDDTASHFLSSANSSVVTGPNEMDDDVSHLGDDMDMSVHTMDALMMQGLSEEQAKEALAKDAKIASLYEELREHAKKASQLQTLCANQKAQIERFAEMLNEKEGVLRSTQSNYDFAKSEHDSLYKRFCDIELQLTLEQEKVDGLERQLHARTHESNLRNDQFKCRFQVQNERIMDLEQQQQSLYAAFELLQQEVKAQEKDHTKLKSSLDEADSEVARQLRESEKKRRGSRRSSGRVPSSPTSQRNLFDSSLTDFSHPSPPGTPPVVTATPVTSQLQAFASMNESTANMFHPQEQSPQQQGIDHPMRTYGYLWKLDKIKGWKRRFFVLYGEGGVYQMTYSDSPKERVKGTIHNITMGVSTVAETNKSIKKPFSFVLHVDPLQHSAPVLYAAASTAEDFKKWMMALKAATIRPEDSMYMSQPNLSAEALVEADMEVARRLQSHSASSRDLGHHTTDHDSQIEADHLMAMRMQIQNQPNQAFA